MAKAPPKLSGLVRMGAVVAASPAHELPDMPTATDGLEAPAEVAVQVVHSQSEPALETGRNMRQIGIHLIDPNPLAPREVYTAAMILERAEDLRAQGQHDAIHVILNPNAPGRFIICDGWTRVQACREHKVFDSLLAEVHGELSLEESAWFGYEQNECRAQHCDLDRAMFYEKLIAAGETAAEISRRAKLSKTMMSFYRAYAKLPEDVLEIVRETPEKFGALVAYQLQKVSEKCGARKAVALAGRYAGEDQPVRWLTNQAQLLLNPTAHAVPQQGKTIKYTNGVYKQRGDLFELVITVPAERREEFAKGLEQLLSIAAVREPEAESPV
jgi:ParB family chromosome partitioning protein